MLKIYRANNYKKPKYYAVTDKGIIWGSSEPIVQRKIDRLGAKEMTYSETPRANKPLDDDDIIVPF